MRTIILALAALGIVGCADARTSAAPRAQRVVAVAPPPGACVVPPAPSREPDAAGPASAAHAPGAPGCADAAAPAGAPREQP